MAPVELRAPRAADFIVDLNENFRQVWNTQNLVPLAIGAGSALAARPADGPITDAFVNEDRWRGFDRVGWYAGKTGIVAPAIGGLFLTGRFTGDAKFKRFTYSLAQGFVVNKTLTASIKSIGLRDRPDSSNRRSFPSGHTSTSFMWATVVSRSYGWKAGVPAYAFASYIGSSRLKSRKHFLTDIVAGATIGYIAGRTVTRKGPRVGERRARWRVGVPPGGGVALNIGVRPCIRCR